MREIETSRKELFCRFRRLAESAARPVMGARFPATAALAVAVLATTAATPTGAAPARAARAGAARHAVPGDAAPRASAVLSTAWIHIAGGGNLTCGIREGNTLW